MVLRRRGWVVLVGALACTPVPTIERLDVELDDDRPVFPPPPVDPMPEDARISLSRTACLGDCPVYEVVLRANGDVVWLGGRDVAVEAPAVRTIPREAFAALWRIVASAPFEDLPADAPRLGDEFCPSHATCMPSAIVVVEGAGLRRRVEDYHGCTGHELLEAFRVLEDRIDEVAGTDRWIRGR
jgi:hypothetical protein